MKTFAVVVLYVIVATLGGWIVSFLADCAGALGALIGSLGRPKNPAGVRKVFAVVCCSLGQTYVFLTWVAFVVAYTTLITRHQPVVGWLVWITAFYASMVPLRTAARESRQAEQEDPQVRRSIALNALNLTCILDVLGFFLFIFVPTRMLYGWAWVPCVNAASQP